MDAYWILLVFAVLLFAGAALLAFGTVTGGPSIIGLIATGLACFAASHFAATRRGRCQ